MIARPLSVILCFGVFILFQSLVPKVMALKKSSKVNEFMLEDQRTRKRKDYAVTMTRDDEMVGNNDKLGLGPSYDTGPFQPYTKPQELLAFIVDYANMIGRNDVVLLDNSVEPRTGKQANVKVKKSNEAFPDPLCSCEYISQIKDMGTNVFPRYVETRNCNVVQQNCRRPYVCTENLYDIIILRKRENKDEYGVIELPSEFQFRWIAEKRPISVGCICAKDYMIADM